GNIIAGLIGAWLGETLFGDWGPQIADLALLPAIAGAIIFVLIIS
ncbi:MAG: GlsB/YeaQ/YmgE family stress response membrane protein, partial [Bacillota bacterium]|nr:GlsB/YeaQ/YmgE family stress response membrane protein [Bacillota bacterium]